MGAESVEVEEAVGAEVDASFFSLGVLVLAVDMGKVSWGGSGAREDAPVVETYAVLGEEDALIGVEVRAESVECGA